MLYLKKFYSYIWHHLNESKFTRPVLDCLSFLRRYITVKKVDISLLTNIEWFKEYDIPIKWFYEKKEKWISWVARLRNADHFLEMCIESYLPFLDELILVDNKSTDKTKEICLKLQKKYPEKIKVYDYIYDVNPTSYDNKKIPSNSIHSLAYYYNRCFSKTKYSHVVKVDDDLLMLNEKWKAICDTSLTIYENRFNSCWWLNICKDTRWNFCVIKWKKFAGYYWDYWIYKVSPYAYYIQWDNSEILCHNFYVKRHWFAFFHLKFLKPNFWLHNVSDIKYRKDHHKKYSEALCLYDFDKSLDWEKYNTYFKYIKWL